MSSLTIHIILSSVILLTGYYLGFWYRGHIESGKLIKRATLLRGESTRHENDPNGDAFMARLFMARAQESERAALAICGEVKS